MARRTIPISVSKKILADVSTGIYRTPANALKEIVSNAFDASAHRVFISTNAPYFDVFTCEDDGEGISAKEFEEIMKRIGSSTKRSDGIEYKEDGRPIIGKIGIGILAVAQICNKFSVISKKRGEQTYFQATVDLRQFNEVEKEKNYGRGRGEISLGTCEIEDDLKDELGPKRQYTKIIMEDIKEGFRAKLLEEEAKRKFKITGRAFKSDYFVKFVDSIKKKKFNEVSQYDHLIWELGLLCPVEYIDVGPLPDNTIIRREIKQLKNYNFKVFVDGYEIRKPVMFPTEKKLKAKEADYKIYPYISYSEKFDGSELSFTGYIFHQRKKIDPAELQGILIRIKGVAVGSYDRTFLHYPKAEGPMPNQLSGEIFVEIGLEEALNIDRNSFNETHIHFLKLQEFLWDYLGGEDGVFKDIRRRSKERQEKMRSKESQTELRKKLDSIKEILGINITVQRRKTDSEKPYIYNKKERKLVFYSHPFWAKNRRERLIQEKLILAVNAAKQASRNIESFEKNLLKLFAHGK